jgi:hypothetical protein
MKVKGTSLIATKKFVYQKFGQEGVDRFIAALPPESKVLLTGGLLANNWYPAADALIEPSRQLCRLFYDGDERGAWEVGAFSADDGLRGIYRFFARIATVEKLLSKTADIFHTYYQPGRMEVAESGAHRIVLRMLDTDERDRLLEVRICGWLDGALRVCGNTGHRITIGRSLARGDPDTEFIVELT